MFGKELAILLLLVGVTAATRPPPSPVSEDTLEKVAGSLEMYVDRLPQMPKIHGYSMEHGRPTPVHLGVGMYQKKWVRFKYCLEIIFVYDDVITYLVVSIVFMHVCRSSTAICRRPPCSCSARRRRAPPSPGPPSRPCRGSLCG
jgi:hypothetical protein